MCLIFVNPTDSVGGKWFCMDSIWNLSPMYCTDFRNWGLPDISLCPKVIFYLTGKVLWDW